MEKDEIDVIWETVGGETTMMLFQHLAKRGHFIVIGGITGYQDAGFPKLEFNNISVINNKYLN